jgi:hypothetical protein
LMVKDEATFASNKIHHVQANHSPKTRDLRDHPPAFRQLRELP